jgi:hypothetical protein
MKSSELVLDVVLKLACAAAEGVASAEAEDVGAEVAGAEVDADTR